MLQCSDDSYYAGHTDDIKKRLAEHQAGLGCSYTTKRLPVRIVWLQEFATREEAKDAEAKIKGWGRPKKEALVIGDFASISVLAKKQDWAGHRTRKRLADTTDPE